MYGDVDVASVEREKTTLRTVDLSKIRDLFILLIWKKGFSFKLFHTLIRRHKMYAEGDHF